MEHTKSRRWRILLTITAILAFVALLAWTYRKYELDETSSRQESATGPDLKLDLDLGVGPVVYTPTGPDDISIRLRPKDHIYRRPRTTYLHWNVTRGRRRPDGVGKEVYLINGEFPGPTVEMRSGDELVVMVHNGLSNESTSIHWHGLHIANEMDGVVGITQCAVAPGQEFEYRLVISEDQSGTFWYHAHAETQRADGLFGSLVVHDPVMGIAPEITEYAPIDDQVLMVGDWFHHEAAEALESYTDWQNTESKFVPDSILLNGKGYFECSRASRIRPIDCVNNAIPHFTLFERSRLRVVNVGALKGFTISVVGYKIVLVQVDGGSRVETMISSKIGVLYPGERMDLILERQSEHPSAWVTISLDRGRLQFVNPMLIETQQFPIVTSPNRAEHAMSVQSKGSPNELNWIDLSGARMVNKGLKETSPPMVAEETILLYAAIRSPTQFEYRPQGFINQTSWSPSYHKMPLLAQERSQWSRDPAPMVERVQPGHWVELVINNLDDQGYPFHLHGHDFHVLQSQTQELKDTVEQYNPFDEHDRMKRKQFNFQTPLLKDTVYVPSMGYVVLAFRATNPGLWLLHNHVLWHEIGMNLAIQVGPDANVSQRNAARKACGG